MTDILEYVKVVGAGVIALILRGVIGAIFGYLRSDARVAKLLSKAKQLEQTLEDKGIEVDPLVKDLVEKISEEIKKNEK